MSSLNKKAVHWGLNEESIAITEQESLWNMIQRPPTNTYPRIPSNDVRITGLTGIRLPNPPTQEHCNCPLNECAFSVAFGAEDNIAKDSRATKLNPLECHKLFVQNFTQSTKSLDWKKSKEAGKRESENKQEPSLHGFIRRGSMGMRGGGRGTPSSRIQSAEITTSAQERGSIHERGRYDMNRSVHDSDLEYYKLTMMDLRTW